jgi:hypothetical protein
MKSMTDPTVLQLLLFTQGIVMSLNCSIVTIRASSLGDLFDCPARWEAKHILGMTMPMGGAAALGRAVHASTAVFDQSTIDQAGITIDEAAAAAVDSIHKPGEDVAWDDEMQPAAAEGIAIALHKRYCATVAPTQTYRAVEVKCDRLEIADLAIALTGTVDRVHLRDDANGITDLKTGKTAVNAAGEVSTKGHAYQLGVYELLAQAASGLAIDAPAQIVGMQTGKTEKAQRIAIAPVHDARAVLLGDEHSQGLLHTASNIVHSGSFFGNPRSMLCNQNYCPRFNKCAYRK